jgi:hypothetical protein
MPLLYLGFLSVALIWLFFAMVWAVALLFWPVTLAIVALMLWRGRWRWPRRAAGERTARASAPGRSSASENGAFENAAFEAYREEALHRIDEEQGRFREFLERLRRSRDKQEFDAYMAARRDRTALDRPPGNAFPA